MKLHPVLAAFLLGNGCASSNERQQTALMDEIESQVRLPHGARDIGSYARAYKFLSPSSVTAFYFIPDEPSDAAFCQATRKYGHKNGQIVLACPPPEGMKAGERRWLGDDVHLPAVSDGGCNYVDVQYDMKRQSIMTAECNGPG